MGKEVKWKHDLGVMLANDAFNWIRPSWLCVSFPFQPLSYVPSFSKMLRFLGSFFLVINSLLSLE